MKKELFVILVFVLVWLGLLGFGLESGQHSDFVKWVKENGTDDWYAYPIMKHIGLIGYGAFGDMFFLAFPLIIMLCSLAFLLLTCRAFNFNPLLLLLVFLPVIHGIRDIGFFTHDAPQFLVGSAFAYYFFLTIYKHKYSYLKLFFLAFASLFFRESGILFIALAFVSLWIAEKSRFKGLFGFLPFSVIGLLKKTSSDFIDALQQSFNSFKHFNPYAVFKYFNNPVFALSFVALFLRFDKWHFLIVLLTFIYVFSVANNDIYYGSVFRYTFSLTPLHLFYVLRFLKCRKNKQ